MGLFRKEKTFRKPITPQQIAELRQYVDKRLDAVRAEKLRREQERKEQQEKEQEKKPALWGNGVKYSLRDPGYDSSGIINMAKFLDDAKKDSALYSHPALQQTYHQWERENAVRKTFSSEVMRYLQERNIRPADFYRRAQIDKRVFHSMKSDYLYRPSKATAFRCCAGLRLSYGEASELLKLAGYSLSPSDSRDLVLRFCLENGICDIYSINCMLSAMGEKEFK